MPTLPFDALSYDDVHPDYFKKGERYHIYLPDAVLEATLTEVHDIHAQFIFIDALPGMVHLVFRQVKKICGKDSLMLFHPSDYAIIHNYATGIFPLLPANAIFRLKPYFSFREIADVPILGILSVRKANCILCNFVILKRNERLTAKLIRDFSRAFPPLPEVISRIIRSYAEVPGIRLPKY
jgi:hypothetical protein